MSNIKISHVLLLVAVLLFILAVIQLAGFFWSNYVKDSSVKDNPNTLTNAEEASEYSAEEVSGYLYFNSLPATAEGQDGKGLTIFAYDLNEDSYYRVMGEVYGYHYNFIPLNESSAALLANLWFDGEEVTTPIIIDTKTAEYKTLGSGDDYLAYEMAIDDSKEMFAYSLLPSEYKDTEGITNIEDAVVYLFNPYTDEEVMIEGAVSPQWSASGAGLFYLKSSGIYYYDLRSDESVIVSDKYSDLNFSTDLAVYSDSQLILTLPQLNSFALFELEIADAMSATEVSYTTEPGVVYSSPEFSPDGQYYSLVTYSESDDSSKKIELKSVRDNDWYKEIVPAGLDLSELTISDWSNISLSIQN